MKNRLLLLSVAVCLAVPVLAQEARTPEERAAAHLEKVRSSPALLQHFLRRMPKGGDLHNHLPGAVYAESYIEYAVRDGLCIDVQALAFTRPPCDEATGQVPARRAYEDAGLYNRLVDGLSIRNLRPGVSGHTQFFNSFMGFDAAAWTHRGDMLAEVVNRAAREHVIYQELITALDHMEAMHLGTRVGFDPDLEQLRRKLMAAGMGELVAKSRRRLDEEEARMRELLRCGQKDEEPGCQAVVRYSQEVHRAFAPEQVFAEIVFGFEMAAADPRVVSVNPVMPENDFVPRRDFDLHMRMFAHMKKLYPQVRLSMHAGELALGLVPPEAMRSHIRKTIEVAGAERVGHGTSVLYEENAEELLREMARRGILVEVCPTSFVVLLGTPPYQHPMPAYLEHGVPVAIATDDIGVARSDTTAEFQRAVELFHLDYAQLKRMVRNSLQYSFLEGDSLWADYAGLQPVAQCPRADLSGAVVPARCAQFLKNNPRARVQQRLESQFAEFESRF